MPQEEQTSGFFAAVDEMLRFLAAQGVDVDRARLQASVESVSGEEHPNLGQYLAIKTKYGQFWISARNKLIRYSARPRFTVGEARAYAAAFLRREVPDFERRNFVADRAEVEEPFWIEEYTEHPIAGSETAVFPNWLSLVVNLDARSVQSFDKSDLDLRRTRPPVISQARAREIVAGLYPASKVVEMPLMEFTSDGGATQRTIWSVTFVPDDDPDSPQQMISIDADTGETVP
jgi:hypothetical protein